MNSRGKLKYSNIFCDLSGLLYIVTQVCHLLIQNPWGRCFLITLQMRWVASGAIFKVNWLKTWTILFHKLNWIYCCLGMGHMGYHCHKHQIAASFSRLPMKNNAWSAWKNALSVLFLVLYMRSIFHGAYWRDLCLGCMVVKGSMGKLPCRFSIAQQPHQYSISIMY